MPCAHLPFSRQGPPPSLKSPCRPALFEVALSPLPLQPLQPKRAHYELGPVEKDEDGWKGSVPGTLAAPADGGWKVEWLDLIWVKPLQGAPAAWFGRVKLTPWP